MIQTIDATEREDRNWGMAAHLSALVGGMVLPFGHVIGPLAVYLANRDKRPLATEHAKASLNFQITLSIIYAVLIVALCVAYFGFIAAIVTSSQNQAPPIGVFVPIIVLLAALIGVGLASIVFVIIGAVTASHGRPYRYPFSIDFVK
jgi:uncharacterized Tic20 family protein